MEIRSGSTIATVFIDLMKNHIEKNFFYINNLETVELFVEGKLKQEFFEILLNEPIILYARKGSIKESTTEADLKEHIDSIINYNNSHVLIALKSLAPTILKKLKVKWIIIEDGGDSQKVLPYSLGLLLNMIHTNDQVAGKTSYPLLEKFAASSLECDYRGFKKSSDSFYINLYDIKTESVYITSEFQHINVYDRNIPDDYKNSIFKYCCPICEKKIKVSLNSGNCDKHKGLDKLLKVEQDASTKMLTFDCDHKETDYHNKYKKFGLNLNNYKDLPIESKEDKDIIFLYMFYNFKSDKDKIKFWKNKQNEGEIKKSVFLNKNMKEKYEHESNIADDE